MKTIKSLEKVCNILDCFAEDKPDWSVTELATELGAPKSTIATLLGTLHDCGYVTKDSVTNRYSLSLRFFELGFVVRNQMKIRTYILPALEDLQRETDEIVYLTIPRNGRVLYLEALYPSKRLVQYSTVGRLAPMHSTGVGKAILAFVSDSEVDEIVASYGLVRYTPNTITTVGQLKAELACIREQKYAVDNLENDMSIKCVAVPILNGGEGAAVGSISVSGPASRFTDNRVQQLIIALQKTLADISRYAHLLPGGDGYGKNMGKV